MTTGGVGLVRWGETGQRQEHGTCEGTGLRAGSPHRGSRASQREGGNGWRAGQSYPALQPAVRDWGFILTQQGAPDRA